MLNELEVKVIDDKAVWNGFVDNSASPYFLQTWEWGEFQKEGLGRKIWRLGFYKNDSNGSELVSTCLFTEEVSRFGIILYGARGPMLKQVGGLEDVLVASKLFFANKGFLMIRLDPAVEAASESSVLQINSFKKQGFKDAKKPIQVENAWILDIEGRNDEDLFKWMKEHEMRKKVPNYIRGSVRKGVVVRVAESDEDLEIFIKMLSDLGDRVGVGFYTGDYFKKQYKYLDGRVKLFIAEVEGKPLSVASIAMYGNEASYLYGASIREAGKFNASYLLQWEIIKYARSMGLNHYNFWGVAVGGAYKEGTPLYGYSYFKRSFGGRVHTYIRPQEYAFKRVSYLGLQLQESYRYLVAKSKGVL